MEECKATNQLDFLRNIFIVIGVIRHERNINSQSKNVYLITAESLVIYFSLGVNISSCT